MTIQVDCKGICHMVIVAHHDDDLLFMHTDLRKIIDQGGCLRIVYLTASDADQGTPFANDRECGVESAYWSVLDPAGWNAVSAPFVTQAQSTVNPPPDTTVRSRYADLMRAYLTGHNVWTTIAADATNPMKRILGLTGRERMSVQFLRVLSHMNFAPATTGRTQLYNVEQNLDANGLSSAQVQSIRDVDDKCTYTRAQIVDMLKAVIMQYQPTAIHYQWPEALLPKEWPWPFPHDADHPDHIATARLAREAAIAAGYESRIVQHVCYPSAERQPNVSAKEEADSKSIFQVYARFDYNYGADVPMTADKWSSIEESGWVQRNHYAQRPKVSGGVTYDTSGRPVLFMTGERTSGAHYMVDAGAGGSVWTAIGGRFPRRTTPFRFTDGRLGVIGLSGDSILYYRAQKLDGGWWNWFSFDGPVESDPAMTTLADGRIATVFRSRNGQLRFAHEAVANASWISTWKIIRPESVPGIGRPAVVRSGSMWLVVSLLSNGAVEYIFGEPDALGKTADLAPAWAKIPGWSVPTDTEIAVLALPNNKLRIYGVGLTRAVWYSDFDPSTRTWTAGVQVKETVDGAGVRFAVTHVTNLGPVFAELLKSGDIRVVIGDRVEHLGGNSLSLLGVAATGSDAVTVYSRSNDPNQQTVLARTVRAPGMDDWRALGGLTDEGAAAFSPTDLVPRLITAI
jgi:GlcNAc-PI de-N-acetylase